MCELSRNELKKEKKMERHLESLNRACSCDPLHSFDVAHRGDCVCVCVCASRMHFDFGDADSPNRIYRWTINNSNNEIYIYWDKDVLTVPAISISSHRVRNRDALLKWMHAIHVRIHLGWYGQLARWCIGCNIHLRLMPRTDKNIHSSLRTHTHTRARSKGQSGGGPTRQPYLCHLHRIRITHKNHLSHIFIY